MTTAITAIINNGLVRADQLPRDNRTSLSAYRGESVGLEVTLYNLNGTPYTAGNYSLVVYVATRSGERVLRFEATGSTSGKDMNVTNFVLQLPRYIVPASYLWELYAIIDGSEIQVMPTSSLLVTQTAR